MTIESVAKLATVSAWWEPVVGLSAAIVILFGGSWLLAAMQQWYERNVRRSAV